MRALRSTARLRPSTCLPRPKPGLAQQSHAISITARPCQGPCALQTPRPGLQPRRPVHVHASGDSTSEARKLDVFAITRVVGVANNAWQSYSRGSASGLTLSETVDLLNGPELQEAVLTLTNVPVKPRTVEEVEPFFRRADGDNSGTLSRTEFLAMYLALATQRIKTEPLVLAEGLLGFIDSDRNGRIEGGELKRLLTLMGFPMALLLPIPAGLGVDYRGALEFLRSLSHRKQ